MKENEPKPMLWDVTCLNHGVLETLHHTSNGLTIMYEHTVEHPECYRKVSILPHIEKEAHEIQRL